MSTSTITSKGQTTIPADIRNYMNVVAGDKLEFIPQEEGRVLIVPKTIHVADLAGILPKPKKSASLEDMQRAIENQAGEWEW